MPKPARTHLPNDSVSPKYAQSHGASRADRAIVSGRSSGVEHNLAKVGVVSSNLIARSNFSKRSDRQLVSPLEMVAAPDVLRVDEA